MNVTPELDGPWLDVHLAGEHRVLSWAVVGGGFRQASRVTWRQVTGEELFEARDPAQWVCEAMRERGVEPEVVFLTARRLDRAECETVSTEGAAACSVATVGLSNARRAGDPPDAPGIGTINILGVVDRPLEDAALVEALALVAEARTAALLELAVPVPSGRGGATGSGTDCIAVAAPAPLSGEERQRYAGKHTPLGHALGLAVLRAVRRGARHWLDEHGTG